MTSGTQGLELAGVTVQFGGLIAVNDFSLSAPMGALTGLIGPNGAGKSTSFNVCSGLIRPTSGQVTLFGEDITNLSPQARAQRGLGRTFQRMALCESASVSENVELGREARAAGSSPLRQLWAPRAQRREGRDRALQALELCGIGALADYRPPDLSTGQRRLVELARAIAGDYPMLLLDEPSSGLDKGETERFGDILRSLVAEGRGLLLVEHDMSLVMSVCDYLYVLDFGEPLFDGTPAEVMDSPLVRAAYLGSEAA